MKKYKIVLIYSNGDRDEQDDVFETEWQAEEYALYLVSCHGVGGEILNLSNPGDYDVDDEDPDFEIIEFDDEEDF